MELLISKMNNISILKPKGRLDASTASEIQEKVKVLSKDKQINFVIDMEEVNFIDSFGLGCLVASIRSVKKMGGEIKISSLQNQVRTIFELTRLHQLFEIFDNSDIAVKSFC